MQRTRDGRLILGIFVSSLVPGSAADVDGTLRDGMRVASFFLRVLVAPRSTVVVVV
jgi:hypothetical protein